MTATLHARSETEAVRRYVDVLQRAISGFGENAFFVRAGFSVAARAHTLVLAGNAAMPLQSAGGERRLALIPELNFRTAQLADPPRRWTVHTVGYTYRLDAIGAGGRLLGYHWHPHVPGTAFPHVHLLAAPAELRRLHIVVPHCTLKHVLEFAMRDFAVRPVRGDWRAALDQADDVLRASMGEPDS